VPDEPSLGELSRRLDRAERDWADDVNRLRAEHATDIQRVEREHTEDLRKLRSDVIRPLADRVAVVEKRPTLTAGRWAVIATAVIALAALLVQAYGTIKGVK
jgi:hypothetical protein